MQNYLSLKMKVFQGNCFINAHVIIFEKTVYKVIFTVSVDFGGGEKATEFKIFIRAFLNYRIEISWLCTLY